MNSLPTQTSIQTTTTEKLTTPSQEPITESPLPGKVTPEASASQLNAKAHSSDYCLSETVLNHIFPGLTLAFLGKSSTGKSSIINSLLGGFYSNVSLSPEKSHFIKYSIDKMEYNNDYIKMIEESHTKSNSIFETIASDKDSENKVFNVSEIIGKIPSSILPNITLIDTPGITAPDDIEKKLECLSKGHKVSGFVYVTDVNHAFSDSSEMDIFRKLHRSLQVNSKLGRYFDLVVLVNKYDKNDREHEGVYQKVCEKLKGLVDENKIIRYSAYDIFYHMAFFNSANIAYPNSVRDRFYNESIKIFRAVDAFDPNIVTDTSIQPKIYDQNRKKKRRMSEEKAEFVNEIKTNPFIKYLIECLPEIKNKKIQTYIEDKKNTEKYIKYIDKQLKDFVCACLDGMQTEAFQSIDAKHLRLATGFMKNINNAYGLRYKKETEKLMNDTIDKIDLVTDSSKKFLCIVSLIIIQMINKQMTITKSVEEKINDNPEKFKIDHIKNIYVIFAANNYPVDYSSRVMNIIFGNVDLQKNLENSFKCSVSSSASVKSLADIILECKYSRPSIKYLAQLSKQDISLIKDADAMDIIRYDLFDAEFPLVKRNLKYSRVMQTNITFQDLFKENANEKKVWDAFNPVF